MQVLINKKNTLDIWHPLELKWFQKILWIQPKHFTKIQLIYKKSFNLWFLKIEFFWQK